MKKLIFKFWTHDSWYNFVADISDETVSYRVKSSYSEEPKEGTLSETLTASFLDDLKKAGIENWAGTYYTDVPMLDDGGMFNICYVNDETDVYFTLGMEHCMPEELFYLACAIDACDGNINQIIDTTDSLGE